MPQFIVDADGSTGASPCPIPDGWIAVDVDQDDAGKPISETWIGYPDPSHRAGVRRCLHPATERVRGLRLVPASDAACAQRARLREAHMLAAGEAGRISLLPDAVLAAAGGDPDKVRADADPGEPPVVYVALEGALVSATPADDLSKDELVALAAEHGIVLTSAEGRRARATVEAIIKERATIAVPVEVVEAEPAGEVIP